MRRVLAVTLLSLLAAVPGAHALAAQEDHPLVTRYAGSTVVDRKAEAFGQYMLMTGFDRQGALQGRQLEGKVTRLTYRNPAGRSTLEIFRNYQAALEKAGLEPIFTCALAECGPAYARSAWGRFNGLFVATDGDPRYLAGSLRTKEGTAYVAVMVGRTRTQLDVVEMVAMERDRVVADAAALAGGLDRDGRVSVYGIYLDTDQAVVKPESRPALEQVAQLLRERPALQLYVVGHTDMTGALEHNRQLSEARARAVAAALVRDFGIAASRLTGYGVGPLAPAASNDTEAGRRLNRRVELVAR
jgi:outer membrane protein OmpA-like peptidoglycan-associated protein